MASSLSTPGRVDNLLTPPAEQESSLQPDSWRNNNSPGGTLTSGPTSLNIASPPSPPSPSGSTSPGTYLLQPDSGPRSPPTPSTSSGAYRSEKSVGLAGGLVSFASGGCAGFLVKTMTAPLSRMTILLQVDAVGAGAGGVHGVSKQLTAMDVFRQVRATEGLSSFWKGNWTSIVHKAGATGVNYLCYENIKNAFRPIWVSDTDPGFFARTAAGFAAGSLSLGLAYPFDIVRTRLACDKSNYVIENFKASADKRQTSLIWSSMRQLYRQEGIKALTRGLPCTMLCQGLNIGLNFGIYETLNTNMLRGNETRTGFGETLLCGAVAGMTASTIVQPLDLIRRRQQISAGTASSNQTVWMITKDIVSTKGWRGLYRGLGPELCKVAPAVGLNFWIYEFVRQEVFQAKINPR